MADICENCIYHGTALMSYYCTEPSILEKYKDILPYAYTIVNGIRIYKSTDNKIYLTDIRICNMKVYIGETSIIRQIPLTNEDLLSL